MDTAPRMTHTFYVGDLCYVLDRDQWDTVCAHDFVEDPEDGYDPQGFLEPENLTFEEESYPAAKPFYILRTFYGDGVYEGSDGNAYCVDSGTIGCIRTDYADPEKLADAVERGLGYLHEFDEDLDPNYSSFCGEEDGTIWFDTANYGLSILTGSDWEDEDEEDTEEDDG